MSDAPKYYTAAATCRLCADADSHLAKARRLAATSTAEIESQAVGWIYPEYVRHLTLAYRGYRRAGLGLLARRVRWLAKRESVRDAWHKFDRLNAGVPALFGGAGDEPGEPEGGTT